MMYPTFGVHMLTNLVTANTWQYAFLHYPLAYAIQSCKSSFPFFPKVSNIESGFKLAQIRADWPSGALGDFPVGRWAIWDSL